MPLSLLLKKQLDMYTAVIFDSDLSHYRATKWYLLVEFIKKKKKKHRQNLKAKTVSF